MHYTYLQIAQYLVVMIRENCYFWITALPTRRQSGFEPGKGLASDNRAKIEQVWKKSGLSLCVIKKRDIPKLQKGFSNVQESKPYTI